MCKSTVPLPTRSTYPGLRFFPPLLGFALAVEHVSSCRFSLNDKKKTIIMKINQLERNEN